MEIGPELCFWNEQSHQNGTTVSAQPFSNSATYSHKPSNFCVPRLSGIVLELESDSDSDCAYESKWIDDTIKINRSDLEETVNKVPQAAVVQQPASEKLTTNNDQVDVDMENSLDKDACLSTEVTAAKTVENMDTVPKSKTSVSESNVHKKPGAHNEDTASTEQEKPSNAVEQLATKDDNSSDVTAASNSSCAIPTRMDSTMSQHNAGSSSKPNNVISNGVCEASKSRRSGVDCPMCLRNFVDRRSMNIHSTKAHSGRHARTTQPNIERHQFTTVTTTHHNISPCIESQEREASTAEEHDLQVLDKQDTTTSVSKPTVEKPLESEEPTTDHGQNSPQSSHSAVPTSPQSNFSNTSSTSKRRKSYAVSPSSQNTPDAGCLKLRLVSVSTGSSRKSDQWERSPQRELSRTPRCTDSCSTDNTEPLVDLDEIHSSTKEFNGDASPRQNAKRTYNDSEVPYSSESQSSPMDVDPTSSEKSNGARTRSSEHKQDSSVRPTRSFVSFSKQKLSLKQQQQQQRKASLKEVMKSHPKHLSMDTSLRTPDGLYKCRLCKRVFPNRYSLTGHYKSHYHASQKPYNCEDCGQRYTSPSNLHYHQARNCPIVKLRDVTNGTMTPKSDRIFKQIQSKAIRAVERQALFKLYEDRIDTIDKYRYDAFSDKNQTQLPSTGVPEDTEITTACQSLNTSPSSFSRPLNVFANSDGMTTTSFTQATHAAVQHVASPKLPNLPSGASVLMEPSVPSAFTPNVPRTRVPSPPSSRSEYQQTNTEALQSGSSLSSLHEQLRHLLERACQSDEARQKILAFTSLALLSALGPLAKTEKTATDNFPTSVFQALFSRFPGLINSSEFNNIQVATKEPTTNHSSWSSPPSSKAPAFEVACFSQSSIENGRAAEKSGPGYVCPHCRNQVFPDLTSLEAHIFLVHGKHCTPSTSDSFSVVNGFSKGPTENASGLFTSGRSVDPNHQPSARFTNITPNGTGSAFFLKCVECDKAFSSFTDCQLHFTTVHHTVQIQSCQTEETS